MYYGRTEGGYRSAGKNVEASSLADVEDRGALPADEETWGAGKSVPRCSAASPLTSIVYTLAGKLPSPCP